MRGRSASAPFGFRSGCAVRWEPPHSCGGGALQRSDRDSALSMRFSAGQSSVAASTIDSHPPPALFHPPPPRRHSFLIYLRIHRQGTTSVVPQDSRIDERLQPLGANVRAKTIPRHQRHARHPPAGLRPLELVRAHRPRSLRILQFRRNPPADLRGNRTLRPLDRCRNRRRLERNVSHSRIVATSACRLILKPWHEVDSFQ